MSRKDKALLRRFALSVLGAGVIAVTPFDTARHHDRSPEVRAGNSTELLKVISPCVKDSATRSRSATISESTFRPSWCADLGTRRSSAAL